ncbi:hypothetical protein [Nonomuraea cavernae]|uniref:hypothetical protein n=1 Tax=Nonomuraea cavernae TaxID=2045107 RepID=UPI001665C65C|nr:hypothetical protein [Nonomuraea cavernae]MCA2189923.1 hypothetical protein [Nonomuraea cavernae]
MTLPPAAAGMMSMLGPWPALNEDMVTEEGGFLRTAHAATGLTAEEANSTVNGVQQVYQGSSSTSLAGYWDEMGGQNGYLAQANSAMRSIPVALDGTASVVSAVKVAAGTQAVFGAVEVANLLALGGVAGGAAATARVLLRRKAVGSILRAGSKGAGEVLGPLVQRMTTGPMRRILDNLRLPGGPMGPRPLAAGPYGGMPLRSTGLRSPSSSRSAWDGMTQMVRRRRRGGGNTGGNNGGNNRPNGKDDTGKWHGQLPTVNGKTKAQLEQEIADLRESILNRKIEAKLKFNGGDAGHRERLRREELALEGLLKALREFPKN